MTEYKYSLGVDPGPIPGVVGLLFSTDSSGTTKLDTVDVLQCSPNLCAWIVTQLLETTGGHGANTSILAVEKYVIGSRSTRVATPGASVKTRNLIAELEFYHAGARLVQRSASEVKPWATDARLQKLGLLDATNGMRHARDAARHALFAAVKDLDVPDPLSRRSAG